MIATSIAIGMAITSPRERASVAAPTEVETRELPPEKARGFRRRRDNGCGCGWRFWSVGGIFERLVRSFFLPFALLSPVFCASGMFVLIWSAEVRSLALALARFGLTRLDSTLAAGKVLRCF